MEEESERASEAEMDKGSGESEGSNEGESEGSYDSSDEESFDEMSVGVALELPKRENRGKKYSQLVGEELERDAQFWNHDTWAEEEVDEDYNCSEGEEQYADQTDSDFDEPEEEEEVGEAEEVKEKRRHGVYVDPAMVRNKKVRQAIYMRRAGKAKGEQVKKVKKVVVDEVSGGVEESQEPREVRATTRRRREEAQEQERSREAKRPRVIPRRAPLALTQEQLLEEARRTEEANTKSLQMLQAWEDERKLAYSRKKSSYKGHYDIWICWNSLLSIVTPGKSGEAVQPIVEEKPVELYMFTNGQVPDYKGQQDRVGGKCQEGKDGICAITGEKAKYFDPVTKSGYSCVEAFRLLRICHNEEYYGRLKEELDTVENVLSLGLTIK